jgi:AcrR family transcriptional regulator
MPAKTPRRLGRPPATDSAETRRRILDVARETFAELGWEVTTNKDVAAKAGVTSAALYHYFDSKLEMYIAVYDDVQELVGSRLGAAIDGAETFEGQFAAVLEEAHQLNVSDPSLARFLASARVDLRRHDELTAAWGSRVRAGDDVVTRMVATGIATGEIASADRAKATAYVRTTLVGLSDAVSNDNREHRIAIEGILGALHGTLFKAPASRNGRARKK